MTYYESTEGIRIGRARAIQELKNHGITDLAGFDHEVQPDHNGTYNACAILDWLGY